jgi:hypothetical protein
MIFNYSQRYVDVIDLEKNQLVTLPVEEVQDKRSNVLRYISQQYKGGYISNIRSNRIFGDDTQLVITFEELLRRTPFAQRMRKILQMLEKSYNLPVDVEFTLRILDPRSTKPEVKITLLQCRPQSHLQESDSRLPANLEDKQIMFSTKGVLPQGRVSNIRYVLFVPPEGYYALPTPSARAELGRGISQLNARLDEEVFICVGPGRWGTVNPDLGVQIGYSDIYNTRALVELSGQGVGPAPEPSFGTHFFQDLLEAQIYPLAIFLDDEENIFDRKFFYETPNSVAKIDAELFDLECCLRLIDVEDFLPGHHIELVMDDDAGQAVAFLQKNDEELN